MKLNSDCDEAAGRFITASVHCDYCFCQSVEVTPSDWSPVLSIGCRSGVLLVYWDSAPISSIRQQETSANCCCRVCGENNRKWKCRQAFIYWPVAAVPQLVRADLRSVWSNWGRPLSPQWIHWDLQTWWSQTVTERSRLLVESQTVQSWSSFRIKLKRKLIRKLQDWPRLWAAWTLQVRLCSCLYSF